MFARSVEKRGLGIVGVATLLVFTACSEAPRTGTDGGARFVDASPPADGGTPPPTGRDGGPPRRDAASTGGVGATVCSPLLAAVASCEGDLPGFTMTTCVAAFDNGRCPAAHVAAFQAFVAGGGTFMCDPFNGTLPQSNDEAVAIGMLCPLSAEVCAGISCSTGSDCPGFPATGECNLTLNRCIDRTATCPALPCQFSSDCPGFPDRADCNSALGVCTAI